MTIVGRTYYERGQPVEVLAQWTGTVAGRPMFDGETITDIVHIVGHRRSEGPRNVLIRRENGELVVRPLRGLRRNP